LAEAEGRIETDAARIGDSEVSFIRASTAPRDAQAAELERQREERDRLRRRKTLVLSASLSLAVALLLGTFAVSQWWLANARQKSLSAALHRETEARKDADAQRLLAQSSESEAKTARLRAQDQTRNADEQRQLAERQPTACGALQLGDSPLGKSIGDLEPSPRNNRYPRLPRHSVASSERPE